MKKIRLIIITVIIFVMCLFIAPSILNANSDPIFNSDNGHYYYAYITDINWTDAKKEAEDMTYKPDPNGPTYCGHLVTITTQEEQGFLYDNFSGSGSLLIGAYQEEGTSEPSGGWQWVTGEGWANENWGGGEPNDSGDDEDFAEFRNDGTWNDVNNDERDGFIVEFEICQKNKGGSETSEPEIWVRDHEFQCWQVWVNEQNQFEFVFVWEYANNNHVQILDKDGNIVFYIDLPKGDCQFVADLPDGTYTVQNYHEYGHILREFVISKP